jgi:polar amino acid transport system substrate-binding protein
MQRNKLACTIAAIAGLMALTACGDSGSSDAPTTAKAVVKPPSFMVDGVFTTGTDFTYPPYEYVEADKQQGLDVDFAQAAAKVMGTRLNMVDTRFNSLIPGLQSGRFDAVVSFLYVTPERAKVVDYVPYFTSGSAFVVHDGSGFSPKEPRDVCGHVVATLQGAYQESLVEGDLGKLCDAEGKPIKLRSFPTDTQAAQDLVAGRADVLFADSATAQYRVEQLSRYKLVKSNDELMYPIAAGLAVRKGETELQAGLQRVVDELRRSGELQRIADKWGVGVATEQDVQASLKAK